MKILSVSDQIEERLYSPLLKQSFQDIDLIVGCGDLPYPYLEFLLCILNVALLYVPGNHDPQRVENNAKTRVEGGINLDLKTVKIKGLIFAGIGGSIQYRPDGVNQYTQSQMDWRILQLIFPLLWNRARYGRAMDILVTHSPPAGIHDDQDKAHQGLRAINRIMTWFKPRYLLHGHTFFYRRNIDSPLTQVGETKIINVLPYYTLEIKND
jgi:Icc-related predicted phosphoesterase